MKKLLLIAGGSHSDIPMIEAARALGCTVATSGNRPNDYAHRLADAVHLEDFSDREAMLALSKRLKIDAICPSANDFSMISCAYVAEKLGLPGYDSYETTLSLHHKDRFRAVSKQLGLSSPSYRAFCSPEVTQADIEGLSFPLIVKPIDLTGGKGINRVDRFDELQAAIQNAFSFSRAKRIVIEEFFGGTLHSYSAIIKNQNVIFDFSDNEFSFINPYTVTTSSTPAQVNKNILIAVREETERLASAMNLVDGILHAQFLATHNEFRIIEFTRRPPGDLYAIPVKQVTGVNPAKLAILPFLGAPLSVPTSKAAPVYFSRHCLMADREGIFEGPMIAPEIQNNIVDQLILAEPGRRISNYLNERLGLFFLKYHSQMEMQEKTSRINQLIRAKMTSE